MAAAAASSLLSGILADGLDGPGVVGEGLEGSDWFCAFNVGANESQEVAKTRIESLVDTCISNLRYTQELLSSGFDIATQLFVPCSGCELKPF
jgi:hypothetical protein